MQEHEAQGSSQTKITTDGTGQFKALVELIRNDGFAMSFQSMRQYRQALIRGAESAAGCGKPATYWAPSTALRKLEARHNSAPCILTDGPAEFNDVALVRLSDYEALQAAYEEELFQLRQTRDAHFGELMKALEQVDTLKAECEKLRSIISDLKDWDCDVSAGFLSIPLDLRRRMQEAIGAGVQGGSHDNQ